MKLKILLKILTDEKLVENFFEYIFRNKNIKKIIFYIILKYENKFIRFK
jgi:hypothetical protein